MAKRRPLAPTRCLDVAPTRKSIRLGGRFINVSRISEHGMDHGYLSYILSGKRTPSVSYGRKLAHVLGIVKDNGDPDFEGLLQLIEERQRDAEAENRWLANR